MGKVYLARDRDLNRRVALKVSKHGAEAQRARFVEESQILAQLDHPISMDDIIDIYPASDPVVNAALREAGKYLGIAVAHLVAMCDLGNLAARTVSVSATAADSGKRLPGVSHSPSRPRSWY